MSEVTYGYGNRTEGVGYRGDEKGLRGEGVYRGQETDHQSGNATSAWLGCMLGDQRCRLG